jgi:quercetin 2,3-dioxygenase
MKSVIHRSDTRGHANYGWLDTYHTFSFANYHDPERVQFGALRVLNDDYIEGGEGFGRHPHDNMEIVTIILEGVLEHKDSMGNTFTMKKNDVQVMSAGTGIYHSEYNKDPDRPLRLLQIWVLPDREDIEPRYEQKQYDPASRKNSWQRLVAPDEKGALRINQAAWFSMITLDDKTPAEYDLHDPSNGAYLLVLEGSVYIQGNLLDRRDGIGISDTPSITLNAVIKSEILLIEVPMAGN